MDFWKVLFARKCGYPMPSTGNADFYDALLGRKLSGGGFDWIAERVPYLFRKSGGNLTLAGKKEKDEIVGGSIAWNQLCNGSSVTVPSGHKYIMRKGGNASIGASTGSAITGLTSGTDTVHDLTQMFGSTIADYIYSLETATAGSGVAWFKKLFPKPYYPYNSGELMHVSGLVSHDMTGFNQWDEEWEVGSYNSETGAKVSSTSRIRSTNKIPCIGGATYYFRVGVNSTYGVMCYYDDDENFISSYSYTGNATFTPPTNARYFAWTIVNYGTTYNHDICINLSWDGTRNGEYEPYVKHSYPLDTDLVLRGIPKLDSGNNLYYDGDIYESDGTVTRRYGIVDLGSLSWSMYNGRFVAVVSGAKKQPSSTATANILCPRFKSGGTGSSGTYTEDKVVWKETNTETIYVNDSSYSSASDFKTAMSGVYLVYELATPTTETADPYQSPQIVDDFGTEEYVLNNSIVPVGHDTDYPVNLVAKLEMAPNSPDGDGTYVVKQTNGQNEYVPLIIPSGIPSVPTTDGTYKLTVTVTNGTPTLTWEA